MTALFLFFVALGVLGWVWTLSMRQRALEKQVDALRAVLAGIETPAMPSVRAAAPAPAAVERELEPRPEPPAPPPEPEPPVAPEPRFSLESIVGGRLPIWIGGAALVLAGFFLVRFSIESGLLGPGTRTILAAIFAGLLIAGSEVARRFPAIDDPRIGQVLSGAGIASFYGTLYMAAALYHLIPPLAAFALMLAVTALALALALRHGPPTAIMALVGGFAAPLVAGFDAAGIGPLLVYLGLFIAALFGLAIHRGWAWLAVGASIAGFAWINFLIFALKGDQLAGVGAFAVVLAAGASAALPATGARNPWLRLAPLVAGLVQLIVLAPVLDFGALAWSFYLVLAAAAVFLAWRDKAFLPGALAALALTLVLLLLALVQPERIASPIAAIAATVIFAIPGHLLARRGAGWIALALAGTAAPVLVANSSAASLLPDSAWAALELSAAAATAGLAWRLRAAPGRALAWASLTPALLAVVGLGQIVDGDWFALPCIAAMLALAGWARFAKAPALFALPALPFAVALVAGIGLLLAFIDLIMRTLSGDRLPYLLLPDPADVLRTLALPAAAAGLLLFDARQFGRSRRAVTGAAVGLGLLALYTLAKQPLAIATPEGFLVWGFLERALVTQALLAAGWALLRKGLAPATGWALFLLGLARFVWFDLLVLNPVIVAQSVGAIPLANLAVLHAALVVAWLATLPQARRLPQATLAATALAVLVAVRQAAHGPILTGPVTSGENIGYSAAGLALALFWLWRGIRTAHHSLRIAGLALLTLVTFKVFLVDAAALDGVLRILSFLGLGLALIGIGWAYGRFLGKSAGRPGAGAA